MNAISHRQAFRCAIGMPAPNDHADNGMKVADPLGAVQILREVGGDLQSLGFELPRQADGQPYAEYEEPRPRRLDRLQDLLLSQSLDGDSALTVFSAMARSYAGHERHRGMELVQLAWCRPGWRAAAIHAAPWLFTKTSDDASAPRSMCREFAWQSWSLPYFGATEAEQETHRTVIDTIEAFLKIDNRLTFDSDGRHELFIACTGDQDLISEGFVAHFGCEMLRHARDAIGGTVLHEVVLTAESGNRVLRRIRRLLAWGVDPTVRDVHNRTPLDIAVGQGHSAMVMALLQSGTYRAEHLESALLRSADPTIRAPLESYRAWLAIRASSREDCRADVMPI